MSKSLRDIIEVVDYWLKPEPCKVAEIAKWDVVRDFLEGLDLAFGSLVTVAELVKLQRERDQLRAALRIAITAFDGMPISARIHDPVDVHVESAMIRIGELGICLTDFSDHAEQEGSNG